MNTPTPNNESELDELLRIVRDAGAEDDNYGGENWEHSDSAIQQAKQALLSWRNKAVVEARIDEVKMCSTAFDDHYEIDRKAKRIAELKGRSNHEA